MWRFAISRQRQRSTSQQPDWTYQEDSLAAGLGLPVGRGELDGRSGGSEGEEEGDLLEHGGFFMIVGGGGGVGDCELLETRALLLKDLD